MFTRCTASAVLEWTARNWRRRTGCRLRLGGGTEVVGMVYGEIKTSPGFCRSYYGDVVLVEARSLCYVWSRLGTGGGSSESCRVECRLAIVWSIPNRETLT